MCATLVAPNSHHCFLTYANVCVCRLLCQQFSDDFEQVTTLNGPVRSISFPSIASKKFVSLFIMYAYWRKAHIQSVDNLDNGIRRPDGSGFVRHDQIRKALRRRKGKAVPSEPVCHCRTWNGYRRRSAQRSVRGEVGTSEVCSKHRGQGPTV